MALPGKIRWILGMQLLFAAGAGLLAAAIWGWAGSISALLGGFVGVAANSGAAFRALRVKEKSNPMHLFRALAAAEVLKYALVVLLFCLVFAAYRNVLAIPLLMGFVSTLAVYWVALLRKS